MMPLTSAANKRCRRGFAADIAEDDGRAVGVVFDEVVKIAADRARRQKARRKFAVFGCSGHCRGQQAQLDLAGHGEIALQLLLMPHDLLIEPRVFNGDGDLRGQRGQVRSWRSWK
jgi:hypothetical protein